MIVKSMFDFESSAATRGEGISLPKATSNDEPPLSGYLDHEVIQDVAAPGHLMVNTHWSSQQHAQMMLTAYNYDDKNNRARELSPGDPTGFVGGVVQQSF